MYIYICNSYVCSYIYVLYKMCVCACVYFTSYSYNIAAFVIVNIELIRRQCAYDGVSTYWYPDST